MRVAGTGRERSRSLGPADVDPLRSPDGDRHIESRRPRSVGPGHRHARHDRIREVVIAPQAQQTPTPRRKADWLAALHVPTRPDHIGIGHCRLHVAVADLIADPDPTTATLHERVASPGRPPDTALDVGQSLFHGIGEGVRQARYSIGRHTQILGADYSVRNDPPAPTGYIVERIFALSAWNSVSVMSPCVHISLAFAIR